MSALVRADPTFADRNQSLLDRQGHLLPLDHIGDSENLAGDLAWAAGAPGRIPEAEAQPQNAEQDKG